MPEDRQSPDAEDAATLPFGGLEAGGAASRASVERIGPYRVVEEIGAGSDGLVYRAEQEAPVRREVALKVLKVELSTGAAAGRFAVERQALALMDHPSIATVLDAGTTDDGIPYLVMELVRGGLPLTAYCDTRRLGVSERLRLFVTVCEAIHHAHQRGVVHRDLKPSNVLVTEVDGRPIPKIIDFGIAKAVGQPITPAPPVTNTGQVMGTLLYMSPEQLAGAPIDIRTDVYALGVILYELVSGTHPFDVSTLPEEVFAALDELQHGRPPAPSVRFHMMGDERLAIAAARRVAMGRLESRMRGDIDAIAMRAMAGDPGQRYGTAVDLARDVQLHLEGRPVAARPRSAWHVASRFVTRNRAPVLVWTGIAAAILAGPTFGMIRAREGEAAARQEAETARQVSSFLASLFRSQDSAAARGSTVTAREILDAGAERLEGTDIEQPRVRGTLMEILGTAYLDLALVEPARDWLERALDLRRQSLGDRHPDVAEGLADLGMLAWRTGDLAAADSLLRVALSIREQAAGGDRAPMATLLRRLAAIARERGADADAERLLDRAARVDSAVAMTN